MIVPITVEDVMQAPVETVEPTASARVAATKLFEKGIGSLVVCEGGEPVGIVTDVDMTHLVSDGGDPEAAAVEDVMSSPLITVERGTPLEDAAARMREHEIKRLPVVGNGEEGKGDGTIVGIVTTTDVANYVPHLRRKWRVDEPDADHVRKNVRVDTAYENDEWEFEYLGGETSIDVGDAVRFSKTIDEEDVAAFAEASGDTNRLHLDAEYAEGTRFGQRIAHGTLVVGIVSAALARLPGLTIYLSQNVSYLGPVPLGSRVTAECEVVERIGDERFRLSTTVSADGEEVIDGEAVVMTDDIPGTANEE